MKARETRVPVRWTDPREVAAGIQTAWHDGTKSAMRCFPLGFTVSYRGTNTGGASCPITGFVAGHLVAHAFGGGAGPENIVALTHAQNRRHADFENAVEALLSDFRRYANQAKVKGTDGSLVPILKYQVDAVGGYASVADKGWSVRPPKAKPCELTLNLWLCTATLDLATSAYRLNREEERHALERIARQDRVYKRECPGFSGFADCIGNAEFLRSGSLDATVPKPSSD